jgi:3-dehydroquinate dehydratase-2
MKIVIINGPNLNLLGRREVSIYGTKSMEQVLVDIQRAYPEVYFEYRQSNHEGDLIDWVQGYGLEDASLQFSGRPKGYGLEDACQEAVVCRSATPVDRPSGCSKEVKGIVLNAGGYTHTSVALRDAVACCKIPVVEVHISDITQREEFRRVSLLTDVCAHTIMGHGTDGYKESIEWILGESRA